MKVLTYVVGPLNTNMYVIYDEASLEALIIDPGGDEAIDYINNVAKDLKLKYIIATHGHVDHVIGVRKLRKVIKAPFLLHGADHEVLNESLEWALMWNINVDLKEVMPDGDLNGIRELVLGDTLLRVMHTPGHTPGSVTLFIPSLKVAFTGDTIFKESVGRTDLPGGSWDELKRSLRRLVLELDRDYVIYPGHGPSTTLEHELINNRYLRRVKAI